MKKKSLALIALSATLAACATPGGGLHIAEQGSFAAGGTVKTSAGQYAEIPARLTPENRKFQDAYAISVAQGGQTLHGDHASVFYQVPVNAKKHPLVFLHGAGQSARTWQTTADGREGFQNIFLRQGYPVYLMDQPRRGQAGRSAVPTELKAQPDDQFWYAQFRIGVYPEMNPGVAFPKDKAAQERFFRMMTPDTGAFDAKVITDAAVQVFEKSGEGVFVTHSAGGAIGWLAAMQSPKIKGIVAIEPGNYPFPEGQVPPVMQNRFGEVAPMKTDAQSFKKLTQIPIVIYFGDYIPAQPDGTQGGDQWHIRRELARRWVGVVNKHGGRATLVSLPDAGIKGNTHFPMSDTNNAEVAAHMADWLRRNGLD